MKTLTLIALLSISPHLFAQDNDALIKACSAGDLTGVKASVEGGANVNFKNAAGATPVSSAYMWPDITEYLLSKGADANGGDFPALVNAARMYSVEVIKLLLNAGADPNKVAELKTDLSANTRKLLADEKAKGKQANKYMIKAYEDMIAKSPGVTTLTYTALLNAVGQTNCQECVELLLNAGANPNFESAVSGSNAVGELAFNWITVENRAINKKAIVDYFEKALIPIPAWYKDLDVSNLGSADGIIKLLKDKGANLEDLDNNKRTPLTTAVLHPTPNEELITALVNNGANMKATGMTNEPTDFAKETTNPDKIKVRFDFPGEGRNSNNGGGYSANMDLVNPKPKRVALISYYLYDPGNGKTTGGVYTGSATAAAWRTPDGAGQTQVDGFYSKSIDQLKATFKENGIDLLTPQEFLDTDEKMDFYFGFEPETAKKEKTSITVRRAAGTSISSVASATASTLKICPSGKGFRPFFVANEQPDESALSNFQGGVFSANRKLTSSLGYELAKGLGVDAVVVVYICTRQPKAGKGDFGVNAVVTMMLGPNPGKSDGTDPEAKNLGQFYCGTRTYYSSPLIFKQDKGLFGNYDGMGNILSAHAAKMSRYINGKEKDSGQ
jgi:ankyrin repeat protein